MATAYAALLSLINTVALERAPGPHHPPVPFEKALIDDLLERVEFFIEFLEQGWKGAEYLEGRIIDLVYAAEDVIEYACIVASVRFQRGSSSSSVKAPAQKLEEIIDNLDSIKTEMMLIKDKSASSTVLHSGSSESVIHSSGVPQGEKNTTVGFDKEIIRIMEELEGVKPSRQVISIHGMGGIGKTTLARTVYEHRRVAEYFDFRAWVTVTQEYDINEIFKQVLSCLKNVGSESMDEPLEETVYKSLCGRRYLVVFDDIWDIDAWDKIRRFFPDNNNGSRIILTTRLLNLANEVSSCSFRMKYLDEASSWNLFCEKVFGTGSCPVELEEAGKRIARNCRGLPLAIVVIGGHLAKSNHTIEYWRVIANHLSSYLNDDDHFSRILSLSYTHLPIHLKPCFLYMGVFPEDYRTPITHLMNLWIAEGFLRWQRGKTLEEIAEQYLKELIERNLIAVHALEISGKIDQYCAVHDLLRDLCMKEAESNCFFFVLTRNPPRHSPSKRSLRRFVVRL